MSKKTNEPYDGSDYAFLSLSNFRKTIKVKNMVFLPTTVPLIDIYEKQDN